eukprot:329520-Chlamydomonas_euryale.AAC.10
MAAHTCDAQQRVCNLGRRERAQTQAGDERVAPRHIWSLRAAERGRLDLAQRRAGAVEACGAEDREGAAGHALAEAGTRERVVHRVRVGDHVALDVLALVAHRIAGRREGACGGKRGKGESGRGGVSLSGEAEPRRTAWQMALLATSVVLRHMVHAYAEIMHNQTPGRVPPAGLDMHYNRRSYQALAGSPPCQKKSSAPQDAHLQRACTRMT